MRRTLQLLLLLGIGFALRRSGGGDGADGSTGRPGDGGDGTGSGRPSQSHGNINASQGTGSAQDAVQAEFDQGRATGPIDSSPPVLDPDLQYTGGSIRPRANDYEGQEQWAREAYEHFRQDDSDVDAIAQHTGLSRDDILAAKNNVMRDSHPIRDSETGEIVNRRFDEDADIAAAWNRLRTGNPSPPHSADVTLLNHEVAEAQYFRNNPGAGYSEAHQAANDVANWQELQSSGQIPYTREDYSAPNA